MLAAERAVRCGRDFVPVAAILSLMSDCSSGLATYFGSGPAPEFVLGAEREWPWGYRRNPALRYRNVSVICRGDIDVHPIMKFEEQYDAEPTNPRSRCLQRRRPNLGKRCGPVVISNRNKQLG